MRKKSNEKSKVKSTKDNETLNLDNEIVIGLKTIPSPKKSNTKIQKHSKEKQTSSKDKKINNKKVKNKKRLTNKTKNKRKADKNKITEELPNLKLKQKNKKLSKKQEIAIKKRKIILKIVKWTSLLVLIIAGIIYFLLSPFFNVKNITVKGNEKIDQNEIISLSEIKLEQNTFKFSQSKVEELIKQNAYIDSVTVKRKLPNNIEITIKERKPSFMIKFANAYVYVSTQGYLLEVTNSKLELPIISGYQTKEEDINVGNRLCKEDLQKIQDVLKIMEAANSNQIINLIAKINIEDKNNYILDLEKEKKKVHLGDTSNLSTKMLYILKILEEEKENEGEILVNTDLNNKGAIFREKV